MSDHPELPPGPRGSAAPVGPPVPPVLVPVQTDTGRILVVGIVVFAVAFAVLAVGRVVGAGWEADHPSWLWTCLAGALLGLPGLVIVRRHRVQGRTR